MKLRREGPAQQLPGPWAHPSFKGQSSHSSRSTEEETEAQSGKEPT